MEWKDRYEKIQDILNTNPEPLHSSKIVELPQINELALDELCHRNPTSGQRAENARNMKDLCLNLKDFEVVFDISSGQFGSVQAVKFKYDSIKISTGREHTSRTLYAMKTMSKRKAVKHLQQSSPWSERSCLLLTPAENPCAPRLIAAFHDKEKLYMVMTYIECGTLWNLMGMRDSGKMDESECRRWMAMAFKSLSWLHSRGWVHRDVKPHNFLIDATYNLKISDFGTAAKLDARTKLVSVDKITMPVGTCDYIAPEILQCAEDRIVSTNFELNSTSYGTEVDLWSLGVMLYEMLHGQAPFWAESVQDTYKLIRKETWQWHPDEIYVSPECRNLVEKLLTDRKQRIKLDDVFICPWLRDIDWIELNNESLPSVPSPLNFKSIQTPHGTIKKSHQSIAVGDNMTDLFNGSTFTDELDISLLSEADESHSPQQQDAWLGFTYIPYSDCFARSNSGAFTLNTDHQFLTPVRASSQNSLKGNPQFTVNVLNTAIKRTTRKISDNRALKEIINLVGSTARKRIELLQSTRKPVQSRMGQGGRRWESESPHISTAQLFTKHSHQTPFAISSNNQHHRAELSESTHPRTANKSDRNINNLSRSTGSKNPFLSEIDSLIHRHARLRDDLRMIGLKFKSGDSTY